MINFLDYTKKYLQLHKKKFKDIVWIGSQDGSKKISWTNFNKLANIDFAPEWNYPQFARNLVIVGNNWYLKFKYISFYWEWQYLEQDVPVLQHKHENINKLFVYSLDKFSL